MYRGLYRILLALGVYYINPVYFTEILLMLLPTLTFSEKNQCFENEFNEETQELVNQMYKPLSLTFQLTRNCNLRCVYCSEPPGIASLKLETFKEMIDKLSGMRRIIFSGGEPMQYRYFWEILEYAQGKFEQIVLSTNATLITRENIERLKPLVQYIDVTVDGSRNQHNSIRGNYEKVIKGLVHISSMEIPLSVICVYLPGNENVMHYIAQQADLLGAIKTKILTPIPKGRSINLFQDFVTGSKLERLADFLAQEKQINGWQTRIIISDWMKIGQGHAILIEPDGRAVASPTWSTDDCIVPFANLAEDSIDEFWAKYPIEYKVNHLNKYLERTMIVV